MKRPVKILLPILIILFLFSGIAAALPLPSEYEEFTENPIGAPMFSAGHDFMDFGPAFFIWADDTERREWNILWAGDGNSTPGYYFGGVIALESNKFNVETIRFENHNRLDTDSIIVWHESGDPTETAPGKETIVSDGISLELEGWANTHWDKLHISITGDIAPSYIGFDLFSNGNPINKEQIFIGPDMLNPESQDFKIAASVSEPATMLLLGIGLVGLAGCGRKKFKKKA